MDVSGRAGEIPPDARTEHFRIGEWIVYPKQNALVCDGRRVTIEPRAMETLEFLACQAGAVVSPERLLVECWPQLALGDNPVHKAIAQLRKALGDKLDAPRYIETIRKRGYRLIASVTLPVGYRGMVAAAPVFGWSGGSPFRGLDAFDAADAAIFFGRSAAIAALLQAIDMQSRNGSAMVLLVGASGSGKTSLLRAGLIPRLQPPGLPGLDVVAVTQIPGRGPGAMSFVDALSDALSLRTQPPRIDPDTLAVWRDGFANAPERTVERLATHVRAARQTHDPARPATLVLVIDQLEDFFPAEADPATRSHTVLLLSTLARSGCVTIVAACRSDAYPRLSEAPGLLALKQPDGHVDLPPPNAAEIAEIIRRPAQMAALRFEDSPTGRLDDVLRDDASERPHCLPLLQHMLQQLYEHRDPSGSLTFVAYAEMGGIDGALLQHAERSLASASPAAQAALPAVLGHLVRYSASGEQIGCVDVALRQFASPAERELNDVLVRNRLLVSSAEEGEPIVAIAHEALLRVWSRASAWIEDNREDLRTRARLAESAGRWRREGRCRDLLLAEGRLLEESRDLYRRRPELLEADARALVDESSRRQRQRDWMRRGAVAALVVLTMAALAGGFSAQRAQLRADRDRARAEDLVDYMLGDLTDRLERLGRLELLDDVAARILREQREADATATNHRFNRSRVLRQLGKIRIARGDAEGAEPQIHESLAIATKLVDERPVNTEHLLNLGESSYWAGYLRFLRGDNDGAATQWQRYRTVAEQATRLDPTNPRVWIESSYALNTLGTLSQRREAHTQALSLFERSVAYKHKALALDPDNLRLRADLADSLSWVADTSTRLGQRTRAQVQYARAVEVLGEVRKRAPDDAEWMHREAILRARHGRILRSVGLIEPARHTYAIGNRLLARISPTQPERTDWARDRIATLNAASELELQASHMTQAHVGFLQAYALVEQLLHTKAKVPGLERLQLRLLVNLVRSEPDPVASVRRLQTAEAFASAHASAQSSGLKDRLLQAELLLLRGGVTHDRRAAQRLFDRARALLAADLKKSRHDEELMALWARLASTSAAGPIAAVGPSPPR
ncbi:MAG: winged helix-turn-helix domain-containing protein [Pseudomonadota bacterium]|nr:winged helix-turn-helix domain-containing protein [Pseudomonadota bacterium]